MGFPLGVTRKLPLCRYSAASIACGGAEVNPREMLGWGEQPFVRVPHMSFVYILLHMLLLTTIQVVPQGAVAKIDVRVLGRDRGRDRGRVPEQPGWGRE